MRARDWVYVGIYCVVCMMSCPGLECYVRLVDNKASSDKISSIYIPVIVLRNSARE